jgi:hypothetical protein
MEDQNRYAFILSVFIPFDDRSALYNEIELYEASLATLFKAQM